MKHTHPLAELIDETRRVNGWSDQDIADRANRLGYKLSKSNISRIRNSEIIALNIGFVKAIAAAMGLPPAMVARAALASAGIIIGVDEWTIEEAIKRDITLSLESKQTLLLMVQSMRIAGTDVTPATGIQQKIGAAAVPAAPEPQLTELTGEDDEDDNDGQEKITNVFRPHEKIHRWGGVVPGQTGGNGLFSDTDDDAEWRDRYKAE